MPLSEDQIKKLIIESIPDATIEIKDLMGDKNHYSAKIKSKLFNDLNKLNNINLFTNHLKEKWVMNYMHYLLLLREKMNISEKIKNIIKENKVCLFMKGIWRTTADFLWL